MTNNNVVYVAICKETGNVMCGAKGQYAFGDTGTLARSVGNNLSYEARKKGIKPKDMYTVHEVDLDKVLQLKGEEI